MYLSPKYIAKAIAAPNKIYFMLLNLAFYIKILYQFKTYLALYLQ